MWVIWFRLITCSYVIHNIVINHFSNKIKWNKRRRKRENLFYGCITIFGYLWAASMLMLKLQKCKKHIYCKYEKKTWMVKMINGNAKINHSKKIQSKFIYHIFFGLLKKFGINVWAEGYYFDFCFLESKKQPSNHFTRKKNRLNK